jgi:hypothetical protein
MCLLLSCENLFQVKSISVQVHGGQGKKRKIMMRFARRLLQIKKDSTPVQLKVRYSYCQVTLCITDTESVLWSHANTGSI